jgi:hypothetical protein
MAPDGAGGALIAWKDARAGGQIYAQHVSASGAALWAVDGLPLGPPGPVQDPMIASDGGGGAVVAWVEDDGTSRVLQAQRLSGAGSSSGRAVASRCASVWTSRAIELLDLALGSVQRRAERDRRMYIGFAERHDEDNAIDPSRYTSQLLLLECDAAGAVVDSRVLAEDQYICNHCGDGFFHLDQLTADDRRRRASGVVAAFRARPIIMHFVMFKAPEIRVQEPITGLAATLVTAAADVRHPRVASDGAGGAIASWEDARRIAPTLRRPDELGRRWRGVPAASR